MDKQFLAKMPALLATLWRYRLIVPLYRITKEECAVYRRLAASSRELWAEFVGFKRLNPDSEMLKEPLGNRYRPFVGMPVSPSQKKEMALQDRLWHYMEQLDKVLKRYQWPANVCQSFKLDVAIDPTSGLEKHWINLNRMATRRLFKDVGRRLSVHETATHNPLGQAE